MVIIYGLNVYVASYNVVDDVICEVITFWPWAVE